MWDVTPVGSPSKTNLPEMGERKSSEHLVKNAAIGKPLTMRRELRIPVRNVHLVYIIICLWGCLENPRLVNAIQYLSKLCEGHNSFALV